MGQPEPWDLSERKMKQEAASRDPEGASRSEERRTECSHRTLFPSVGLSGQHIASKYNLHACHGM